MRVLRTSDPGATAAAIAAIERGGLVGLPTETVYGLACALDDAALERLLDAKGRPGDKGITLLVDSLEQVEALAQVPPVGRRLADRFWPGPLTLVVPARVDAVLPDAVTGGRRTVGFRLPDHPVPRALARALGPIPLTSANRSGEPDAVDATAVVHAVGGALAIVLDGGRAPGGVPSSVVSVTADEDTPIVLREGAIAAPSIIEAARRR